MIKQLIAYFSLAYSISWLVWLPLYGNALGLGGMPSIPYNHALGGLGPLLAAFITTYVFQKKEGVKQLIIKSIQVKPLVYFAVALLSPFVLLLVSIVGNSLIN